MTFTSSALRLSFVACLLSFNAASFANTAPAEFENLYQRAVALFNRGDYSGAIPLFEQAIVLNPQSAGARLDLAQAYCELGNRSRAREILSQVRQTFSLSPEAAFKLEQRVLVGCPDPFRIGLVFSAAVGFSSNANIAPSNPFLQIGSVSDPIRLELASSFRPRSDNFTEAHLQGVLLPSDNDTHQLFASLNSKRYQQVTAFNFDSLIAGYSGKVGVTSSPKLEVQWAMVGAQSTLGGEPFERSARLSLDLWGNQSLRQLEGHSNRVGFGLSLMESRYDQDSQFDASRGEVALKYERRLLADFDVAISLGSIVDIARHSRPGGDRDGFFATVETSLRSSVGETNFLVSGQQLRDSDFYNPLFFPGVRRETRRFFATLRHEISLRQFMPVSDRLFVYGQASLDRSDDKISIFSVENQIVMFGILLRM